MRIIINSVLIVLIGITCGCRNTEKYDHQEKVDLYSYRYQHLYGVTIYDDRLITITKETIQPFKDLISVNLHDMEGNILKTDNYEISNSSSFEVFIHDSQAAAGWVQHEVLNSNDYLWIVAEENKILRRQLILSEKFGFLPNTSLNEDLGKEYFILGRWWLLEIAGRKILFVEKKGTKLDNIKNGPDFIDKLWIYKYALNDDDIQLEGRCCINNDFVRSGRSEIECAAEGDKVYIWICADSDDIRCNTLKVAEWENKEELNWIDCYISKNPLHELVVDYAHGSVAAVAENIEYNLLNLRKPYAVCHFQYGKAKCVISGKSSVGGISQIFRLNNNDPNWLFVFGHCILKSYDENFRLIREKKYDISDTLNAALVLNKNDFYLVKQYKNGFKVQNCEF